MSQTMYDALMVQTERARKAEISYGQLSDRVDELAEENAKLREQLAAAEAKLKAAMDRYESARYGWDCVIKRMLEQIPDPDSPLYVDPIPPADVQELQQRAQFWVDRCGTLEARIAELERKLAAFQAADLAVWAALNAEGEAPCSEPIYEKLNALLAQAREEGRKEAVLDGWQVVPKEPTDAMFFDPDAVCVNPHETPYDAFLQIYEAMLAAAPKPEGQRE